MEVAALFAHPNIQPPTFATPGSGATPMRILLSLSIAAMLVAPAVAQKRAINYTEFDLPNGLHVIIHEDHVQRSLGANEALHCRRSARGSSSRKQGAIWK